MDLVGTFLVWIVWIFNKAEKLNNAEKIDNILTNSQSAHMSVAQHLMTHNSRENFE